MSVKIIQDVIMTLSGSCSWEKRKCFLSEEGFIWRPAKEVDNIFQAPWFVVETYARIPFYRGFLGRRLSRCDGAGFVHGV
jgi:hypothetical protein